MTTEAQAADILKALAEEADKAFLDMCESRHKMGAEKYGPVKFLEVDSFEMGLEELADLANYVRYTYIKFYLLRAQMASLVPDTDNQPEMIGPNSFISAKDPR